MQNPEPRPPATCPDSPSNPTLTRASDHHLPLQICQGYESVVEAGALEEASKSIGLIRIASFRIPDYRYPARRSDSRGLLKRVKEERGKKKKGSRVPSLFTV